MTTVTALLTALLILLAIPANAQDLEVNTESSGNFYETYPSSASLYLFGVNEDAAIVINKDGSRTYGKNFKASVGKIPECYWRTIATLMWNADHSTDLIAEDKECYRNNQ